MINNYNFINGKWSKYKCSKYFVKNFKNIVVSSYPDSKDLILKKALDSGILSLKKNSFHKDKKKRIKALKQIYDYLKKNKNEIIKAELSETGKKIEDVKNEIESGIKMWLHAAVSLEKINFEERIKKNNYKLIKSLEPIGLVALITPWNYPFIVVCERLPYIIASGCSVILKPSEFAAASLKFIIDALIKSSAPNQIINLIYGKGNKIGKQLSSSKLINMISFTGSTNVAKKIIKSSNKNIKKFSLELGGKNPMIICESADLNESVKCVKDNFLENAGQACIAGSILYINSKVYNQTIKILKSKFDILNKFQSPISSSRNRALKSILKKALKKGAKLTFGNKNDLKSKGPLTPYILENISEKNEIFTNELFGTILILKKFKKLDKLIDNLNQSQYGLACFLYTKNKKEKQLFTDKIRYGRTWINESLKYWNSYLPIGGFRNSGYGTETGLEGIKNYLVNKSIIIKE
tara:strand:+ start:204 stop:1601 length:1398 start_codon:yes stop_codon:yes gene_type:complete